MKILLTGASGYMGRRLIPVLIDKGHQVVAVVRDRERFKHQLSIFPQLEVIEYDFLNGNDRPVFPVDIDVAYFLMHSMSASIKNFMSLEQQIAEEFVRQLDFTQAQQIVFLGALNSMKTTSQHMSSRLRTEEILAKGKAGLTVLRAGIIVGSGSASFEIIRDLVEKLPVMIAPRWLSTKIQPIAIRNVVDYMTGVLGNPKTFNQTYDIGGPDILTYKQMLLEFAKVRKLKRLIIPVPVMTPKLSSYWLLFITSTSYNLAVNLVKSLHVESVCRENNIREIVKIDLLAYQTSIKKAFKKIEQNEVVSSWKDAMVASEKSYPIEEFIRVPSFGCYKDETVIPIGSNPQKVLDNIWSIGGEKGWYYASWLWQLRGIMDKFVGGVGLRRGRTNISTIDTGDALDFWRVIYASKKESRLLLFAEMKLPGEAWLEFRIKEKAGIHSLYQTATFRPHGLWGRLYWYLSYPFHIFIFRGMARNIISNI